MLLLGEEVSPPMGSEMTSGTGDSNSGGGSSGSRGAIQAEAIRSQGSSPISTDSTSLTQKGVHERGRGRLLRRFRHQLLGTHRSLHDAFARLERGSSGGRPLPPHEFSAALATLGFWKADSDAIFAAVDLHGSGTVSVMELRGALACESLEALLWELRCRLVASGIQLQDQRQALRKALRLAQKHRASTLERAALQVQRLRQGRRGPGSLLCRGSGGSPLGAAIPRFRGLGMQMVGRAAAPAATGAAEVTSEQAETEAPAAETCTALALVSPAGAEGVCPTVHLDRSEWLHFCSRINLTELEAAQLFMALGGEESGAVDLCSMFATLRCHVAPDVSLERFATRVLARYDSPREAFTAFCSSPKRVMHWQEFRALAEALDVNERNASSLWDVLSSEGKQYAGEESDGDEGEAAKAGDIGEAIESCNPAIAEDIFVRQLQVWAPDTALAALGHQLCERFGDLARGRHAMQRRGVDLDAPLSAATLAARLKAAGIRCRDAARVLNAVSVSREEEAALGERRVTLDALFDAMQDAQQGTGNGFRRGARATVRDDTRSLWQKLHDVQADLSRDLHNMSRPSSRPSSRPASPTSGRASPRHSWRRARHAEREDDHGRGRGGSGGSRSGSDGVDGVRQRHRVSQLDTAWIEAEASGGSRRRSNSRSNPLTPLYQAVVAAMKRGYARLPTRGAGMRSSEATPIPSPANSGGSGGSRRSGRHRGRSRSGIARKEEAVEAPPTHGYTKEEDALPTTTVLAVPWESAPAKGGEAPPRPPSRQGSARPPRPTSPQVRMQEKEAGSGQGLAAGHPVMRRRNALGGG